MSSAIDYRAVHRFDASPERIWAEIGAFDRFEHRWGWLRDFAVEGDGLTAGTVLRGTVTPPLPYRLRLRVRFDDCQPPRQIGAVVDGDLQGLAHLVLEPDGDATMVTVSWTVEVASRPLRTIVRLARPLLLWGHDRVVEATVAAFRRELAAPA